MKKKLTVLSLLLVLLLGAALPYTVYADVNAPFVNGDSECYAGDYYYLVDTENGNYACRENAENFEREYFTSYAVGRVLFFDDNLYVSKGDEIRKIDVDSGKDELFCAFDCKVERFSASENGFYALSDGKIYKLSQRGNNAGAFDLPEKVSSFWLDGNTKLSYMTDEEYIYTLDLITGKTEENVNFRSDLGDAIPVVAHPEEDKTLNKSTQSMYLNTLQNKFPAGKYWNHVGSSSNNPNGYTSKACTHHDSGCEYDGGCGCNSFNSAIQCMGYAYKCAYDVTGYYCTSGSGGWSSSSYSSKIDNVKAGDVIRYRNDTHSVYVIGVSGDTVYITDCNWDHHCIIRWDASVSKSTLKSSFTNIKIAPYDCGSGYTHGTSSYTVKLDANSGKFSSGRTSVSASVTSETTIEKFETPVKEGYDFVGWFTDDTDGSQITADNIHNMGSYSTFYAHWKKKVFTVTFDPNGGENAPAAIIYEYGDSFKIPLDKPARAGYTFESWNTEKDGSGEKYSVSTTHRNVNASLRLYADWEAKPYGISFNPNGGTVRGSDFNRKYNEKYGTLPTPDRNGFTFDGWFTEKENGKGILVTENSTREEICETLGEEPRGTITVYAHWSIRITYDGDGGSNIPEDAVKEYGKDYKIPSEEPTKTGYTFKGWKDTSGNIYQAGAVYRKDASLSLKALWEPLKYEVKYFSDYGFAPAAQVKEYGKTLKLSTSVPSRTGYTMTAWVERTSGKSYKPGGDYTENKDAFLTAKWEANTYTVTFNAMGGKPESTSVKVKYASSYPTLPTVTREGYTFNGWFTQQSGGSKVNAGDKVEITSNMTCYAHWTANEYTVSFDANGGYCDKTSEKYTYDSVYSSLPVPEKDGKVFIGWIYEENGVKKELIGGETVKIADNIDAKACWTDKNTSFTGSEKPAYYVYLGELVDVRACNNIMTSTDEINAPAVPERPGYTGVWETRNVSGDPLIIRPVYTPIVYKAVFVAGGKTVSEQEYTVENPTIVEPAVPKKYGYAGKWGGYYLGVGGVTVNAVYTAEVYTAYFKADGIIIQKSEFTVETISLAMPDVPYKEGYSGQWSSYEIKASDIVIEAVYTPTEYHARFFADGELVADIPFTIKNKSISEPEVPEVDGKYGRWEQYELTLSDITVNAVYVDRPTIKIIGFTSQLKVPYMAQVKFTAEVENPVDGCKICWFINGKQDKNADSEEYSASSAGNDYTVEAKLLDEQGREIASSGIESIKVRKNFFTRLAAYFRSLFRKPKIIIQK